MEAAITAIATAFGAVVGAVVGYLGLRQRLRAEMQRDERTRAEEAQQLLRRYRDPLMRVAFDLQSRLYNIAVNGFLEDYLVDGTAAEQRYARESTLYVLAEYLGWVEIVRQEVQFLDLGSESANQALGERLDAIRQVLLTKRNDTTLRVFRGEQRAIGELMTTINMDRQRECLGFATFVERRRDANFKVWFETLEADIDRLAVGLERHDGRLVALQHALVDLLDFLDPTHRRFLTRHRDRVDPDQLGSRN